MKRYSLFLAFFFGLTFYACLQDADEIQLSHPYDEDYSTPLINMLGMEIRDTAVSPTINGCKLITRFSLNSTSYKDMKALPLDFNNMAFISRLYTKNGGKENSRVYRFSDLQLGEIYEDIHFFEDSHCGNEVCLEFYYRSSIIPPPTSGYFFPPQQVDCFIFEK